MTYNERQDRVAGLGHRFRFVHDVPLHESNAALRVHCIAYWEIGDDQVRHGRWVTDVRVSKRNVSHLRCGGRARWKIENETCTTRKNQGDNLAHHDGHGQQNLAVVFALLLRLACLVDQTPQRCGALFRAVWAKVGSKRL